MTSLSTSGGARPRPTLRSSLGRVELPLVMPYVYIAILGVLLLALQPGLIDGPGAIQNRFSLVVPLALVAFGQTLVLLTRGIDLSIGGAISLVSALLATKLNGHGALLVIELVAVVALGVAIGCLNGLMITMTGIQPFIVTLAAWSIWDGVAFAVLPVEGGNPSLSLSNGISGSVYGVPVAVIVVAVLFILWNWLRASRLVRDLVAIGSDETRAHLTGVRVRVRKIQAYAFAGCLAALAGIWLTASTQSGSPNGGDQFILNSIAAVVLGGTSIFGGKGSAASSIAGAIAFLMIPNVVFALGLTSFWSIFFQGLILIAAVVFNSLIQRRTRSAS